MTHKLRNYEEQTHISSFLMLNEKCLCLKKQKRQKRFKFHISHFVIDLVKIFPSKQSVRRLIQKVSYDNQHVPKSHVNGQNLLNIVCSQFICSVWIV